MSVVLVGLLAFLVSEPLAALAHRRVMHGSGWRLHRSHHRRRRGRVEANDLFPVVFAGLTILAMAAGSASGRGWIVAAGAGVSAYGLVYATVHDVCIHGRLTGGRPVLPGRWLRWVAACHAVHHRAGGAPYGFLVPIVPTRHRAAVPSFTGVETLARVENTS